MIWYSHMSSLSLAPPQASGSYDGGLLDSIPSCSAKTVEAGPRIPSYLCMASKQKCVSPGIALFGIVRSWRWLDVRLLRERGGR